MAEEPAEGGGDETVRFSQQRGYSGRPRRWAVSWVLVACVAAGLAGLAWLALALLDSPPAGTASSPGSASVGPASWSSSPASPPVRVCGNDAILGRGPTSPPKGAVVIPAGNNSGTAIAHNWTIRPDTTYWFAPGTHTLGRGKYSQIIPANGDTFIGAPGAVLDGQRSNLYAFTQQARDVTIRYLTIKNFGPQGASGGQGVVNHDRGPNWHIDHITVRNSAGAGVMLGSGNVLAYSCLKNNGEYGFQGGDSNITADHNEVVGNNTDDWENLQPGCGCSGGAKFWGVKGATITNNYVHDNHGPGLWADTDNRGFDVENNYIANNAGEGFIYEISYNLRLANNTFVHNAVVAGPRIGGFPAPAVFISESGADSRVPGPYGRTLTITGNRFTDNWAGVVLWENADRFCGSPANTSTGECTLVNPEVATIHSCNATKIFTAPYYSNCRWKTQNVFVSRNYFFFNPANIGPECTPAKYCGFNGIFSQWGSEPSWSPYHGTVIENNIIFHQNNHFMSNIYEGPWQFVARQQGNAVDWATWRGSPYRQDAGSTMNRRGA
jgi:Right handed beta helix region